MFRKWATTRIFTVATGASPLATMVLTYFSLPEWMGQEKSKLYLLFTTKRFLRKQFKIG